MKLAHHCELCDHQEITLKDGTTCGLTNRKPEFNKTCSKIMLTDKFETKLKTVNTDFEKIYRAKTLTYIYFIVFVGISMAVIIGGYSIGKYALDNRVFSVTPLIIMAVGIIPLGMAFGTLNKHRRDLSIARTKKEKVDRVLELYNIRYDIDISFGKEYHGTQDIGVDLKVKGIR